MGRQTTIWIIGGLAMFGFGWLLGTPSRVSDTPRQVRSHPSVAPPNDQLANASTEQLLSQLSAPSPSGWLEETWRRLLLSRLAESDQTAIAQLSEEEQKLAHAIRISNDPLSQWHTTDRTAQEPHEYRHLLEALSKADPIAFLDITSDKTVTITGSIDWDSIYRHLFSESLQKALDYHESHRQLRTTNSFLKRWSERDPSAAWEWLGTSGLANSHHQLAILENWFQKDFPAPIHRCRNPGRSSACHRNSTR